MYMHFLESGWAFLFCFGMISVRARLVLLLAP